MSYSPPAYDRPAFAQYLSNLSSPCFPVAQLARAYVSGFPTAQTWVTANQAYFYPFVAPFSCTAYQLGVFTGSSVGNNFDIGIYDAAFAKLVSTGSTAHSGTASQPHWVDVADTTLTGGTLYYLAIAMDSTTANQIGGSNLGLTQMNAAAGVLQRASSFALPANATSPSPTINTATSVVFAGFISLKSTVT